MVKHLWVCDALYYLPMTLLPLYMMYHHLFLLPRAWDGAQGILPMVPWWVFLGLDAHSCMSLGTKYQSPLLLPLPVPRGIDPMMGIAQGTFFMLGKKVFPQDQLTPHFTGSLQTFWVALGKAVRTTACRGNFLIFGGGRVFRRNTKAEVELGQWAWKMVPHLLFNSPLPHRPFSMAAVGYMRC